jgi:hypothetical protein
MTEINAFGIASGLIGLLKKYSWYSLSGRDTVYDQTQFSDCIKNEKFLAELYY